jgi:hypothetical protein
MKKISTLFVAGALLASTQLSAQSPIFTDAYTAGVTFEAFGGSVNSVTVDSVTAAYAGTKSIKVAVPAGGYTGGAFAAATGQNLTTFNAISFWVRASAAKTLNVTGIGNNAATTLYAAERVNVPVTTTWTKVIIPIPAPAKLTAEKGLFHFAEGSDEGAYTIWFDNIQYENITGGVIGTQTASIATETINKSIGDAFTPGGLSCSFMVNGMATPLVALGKAYFNFTSSNTAVATVSALGEGAAVAAGTANVTAQLNGINATGILTVNVAGASTPTVAAPTPNRPPASVLSLFSNAYANRGVDTWSATWDQADVADVLIAGNDTKKYTNMVYAGIEFVAANKVNATNNPYFHIDIWTPNSTTFKIKLVDFGANGVFQGTPNDDTEHELTYTPALGQWVSYNIPLASFTGMTGRTAISQMVLSASNSTVFVDNVYFFQTGVGTNEVTFSKDLFTATPSLADNFVNINLTEKAQGEGKITLVNITGQEVFTQNVKADGTNQTINVATSNLAAGTYIATVHVGNAFQSQKIVVTH